MVIMHNARVRRMLSGHAAMCLSHTPIHSTHTSTRKSAKHLSFWPRATLDANQTRGTVLFNGFAPRQHTTCMLPKHTTIGHRCRFGNLVILPGHNPCGIRRRWKQVVRTVRLAIRVMCRPARYVLLCGVSQRVLVVQTSLVPGARPSEKKATSETRHIKNNYGIKSATNNYEQTIMKQKTIRGQL